MLTPFRADFSLPRLERVIAGPGTIERLASEIDRYECRAALVVTGPTVGASPLAARVTDLLGGRCRGVFTGCHQHVPASTVAALVDHARRAGADSFVSVGGGSPIDTAKAAAHALLSTTDTTSATDPSEIVQIAIPTTLSAGEFTDVAGVTDDTTRLKHPLSDPRIAPRTVIADPEATLSTPDALWAASGIRALDHAVESLYSQRHHPISDPLAARAIEMLVEHLPGSIAAVGDEKIARRGECQMAAWLAVFGVTNAAFGLSHVLGHQIGPRWNVWHGVTSAIVLPHAMRFMADVAPARFVDIARSFGVPFSAEAPLPAARACADRAAAFIAQFKLPIRLRDVGVPRAGIGQIAAFVAPVMERAAVVERPVSAAEIESVLAAAY